MKVSVLFSEPKIPQLIILFPLARQDKRFSALQRAENSSIFKIRAKTRYYPPFQCSSASRKFLNLLFRPSQLPPPPFQCSSASRKFLNYDPAGGVDVPTAVSVLFSEPKIPQYNVRKTPNNTSQCFSALQRAENSSIQGAEP